VERSGENHFDRGRGGIETETTACRLIPYLATVIAAIYALL
jgi:hypothetical protein